MFKNDSFRKSPNEVNSQLLFKQLVRSRVVGIQSFWREGKALKGKVNMSTGILLNNHFLLTAAHNIFVNHFQSIASDIRIFFLDQDDDKITDKNMSFLVKPKLHENLCMSFNQNNESKGYSLDLALIRLKKLRAFPNRLNLLLGLSQQMKILKKEVTVSVWGFPDLKTIRNKLNQRQNQTGILSELAQARGKFSKLEQNYCYYHQITTVQGQSGGPIFLQHQGIVYLIGIHTQYNYKRKSGRGVIFTNEVWKVLREWSQKLNANLQELSLDINQNGVCKGEQPTNDSFKQGSKCEMSQEQKQAFFHFYDQHSAQFESFFIIVQIDTKD